ncbi:PhoX family protein [Rhizobium mesosinicum]|uniref:PhoX family protein n=1 Tax=Rhizobium mesosinicum TaxID=335017 RepID=UPI001CB77738|nr:alkaline phosphatase PhoX [Rhizobium mesosinicum]
MLFSWPLGKPFPFLGLAPFIFTARSNYQRSARRQAEEAPLSVASGHFGRHQSFRALLQKSMAEQVNVANPRGPNPHGHLLELVTPGSPNKPDYAAESFKWDVFALCGDPAKPEDQAMFHPATTSAGWFADPDNLAVDPAGRLWVTTDGPPPEGIADSVYVMDTESPGRALPKLIYIALVGSETCSPTFNSDGSSVFLSVQHPGELHVADNEDATSMEDAGTNWPDFKPGVPARPSFVVLTHGSNRVGGS